MNHLKCLVKYILFYPVTLISCVLTFIVQIPLMLLVMPAVMCNKPSSKDEKYDWLFDCPWMFSWPKQFMEL